MSAESADQSADSRAHSAFRDALVRGDDVEAERLAVAWPGGETRAPPDVFSFRVLRALDAGDPARARALAGQGIAVHPGSALLSFQLGRACEALGESAAARDAFRAAHDADPRMTWALFSRADMEEALGRHEPALALSLRALGDAEAAGWTTGTMELPNYVLQRMTRALDRARSAREEALDRALHPVRGRHGTAAIARVQLAFDAWLGKVPREPGHALQKPTFLLVPGLPASPWFERDQFPFLAAIEDRTDEIREELLGVLADAAQLTPYVDMPDQAPAAALFAELNRSPRWGAYHFWRHGERVEDHCQRCPRTAAALDSLPLLHIPGHSPESMFSVLRPHTHIPPHAGVINGRLTVHLPLIVPPQCGKLAVAHEARRWRPGRCLVFDDSYIHEAINESDQTRVVLIFDVWNPWLAPAEREALAEGISAIGGLNRRFGLADPG